MFYSLNVEIIFILASEIVIFLLVYHCCHRLLSFLARLIQASG